MHCHRHNRIGHVILWDGHNEAEITDFFKARGCDLSDIDLRFAAHDNRYPPGVQPRSVEFFAWQRQIEVPPGHLIIYYDVYGGEVIPAEQLLGDNHNDTAYTADISEPRNLYRRHDGAYSLMGICFEPDDTARIATALNHYTHNRPDIHRLYDTAYTLEKIITVVKDQNLPAAATETLLQAIRALSPPGLCLEPNHIKETPH
jgi:hypothetical protein